MKRIVHYQFAAFFGYIYFLVTLNNPNLMLLISTFVPDIKDDGCVATLPFEWGQIDIVTTPPPTTTEPTVKPVTVSILGIKDNNYKDLTMLF